MTDALDSRVERLLIDHVDSIAQLELLLLLHGRPAEGLTAAAVARELGMAPAWTATELANLASRGFLRTAGSDTAPTFRFAPEQGELAEAVDAVARAYRERRLTVVERIANKPSRHILGFADAFRLRKD